ncbi:MAG: ammonium transporter, Amt family [Solirubrobacteraceae bacterium]|jgi:Amt family ammonium transporter|nr:ammonium transporter, Amt family [Solirubrobacteraceae bacterium]
MKGIDSGDTAWMLAATALVLLMTPALGLFYAGLVRSKNALNTFMMCVGALGVVTIAWALIGYSFAFDDGNGIIGGFGNAFLHDVGFAPREGQTIPHLLFMAYQGTFCIVTSALVAGAVVERMRFLPFLIFMTLWSVLVYAVLAHWVFGGGWLQDGGTLDFAGGVPVEMGSGFSAFAAAIAVGSRRDYGRMALLPHNAVYALLGAGLLWFGWFGFNGGSGLGVNDAGVLAFTNTLLAPACTLTVWFVCDLIRGRQVTAIGAATAIVVGCVGITPAAGYVSPVWSMVLGALAAIPSYLVIQWRPRTRLDETLDVLAAHGLAGLFGIVFIGFFAQKGWNGVSDGLLYGNAAQLGDQLLAVATGPAYAFCGTWVLLKGVELVFGGLRVTPEEEATGLDLVAHGEEAYASGEGAILLSVPEPATSS